MDSPVFFPLALASRRVPVMHTVGGVLTLEMDRGVHPALSNLNPVTICHMAQKTPCPVFEINTKFN